MDITTRYVSREQPQTVVPLNRPVGAAETGFAQNIQDATRQAGRQQTAPGTQPQAAQPSTAENMRARSGALPGVTPLTPNELDLRQTAHELQTRQMLNNMAGRMTAPTNIADYPQTVVAYAGQLAAQVSHAGFALPDSPARVLSTPRRGQDVRGIEPVDDQKAEVRGQRLDPREF